MEQAVQIFKALGDETRLKILIILSRRKICAKGIAKHLNISEAAVSQHLKILKESGIVVGVKSGYFVHYILQEDILSDLLKFIEHISNEQDVKSCRLNVDLPDECGAVCKAKINKCCQKNKIL